MSETKGEAGFCWIFNMVSCLRLIVFEANADASCYPEFLYKLDSCPRSSKALFWPWVCNLALQMIYSAECIASCCFETRNKQKRDMGIHKMDPHIEDV